MTAKITNPRIIGLLPPVLPPGRNFLINYDYQFCSFHKSDNTKCFYNKLKEEVQKSNLLVINHSLLATIYNKEDSLFEDFNLCVIDEGHKITENWMNGIYSDNHKYI